MADAETRYREWRETAEGKAVFALFERFALQLLEKRRPFGFRLIAERARWEMATTWKQEDVFKINNVWTPLIGRELAEKYPDMRQYVEFRKSPERRVRIHAEAHQ